MQYISTRGKAETLNFKQVLLCGLANDGGLYVPDTFPYFDKEALLKLQSCSYTQLAKTLLYPFVEGSISKSKFEQIIDEAYAEFNHKAICPIVQTDNNEFILELFHGPTLAFKDIAMQLLARLMDHFLTEDNTKATVIGATSGDTGGAAIKAYANLANANIFILFPEGKISAVQQKQMTSSGASNVYPLAIAGNFDDCQTLVKQLFRDLEFKASVNITGVNSINWARIMGQIVYYFYAAFQLGAPERKVSFTVPTGNFGDIFAGFVAYKMGLPIEKLVIATNENNILFRTLSNGEYKIKELEHTIAPSMDIQISSNFERLIFECSGRNSQLVREKMDDLANQGSFTLEDKLIAEIKQLFAAGYSVESETKATIKDLFVNSNYLADPHTAIAVKVSRDYKQNLLKSASDSDTPMVILSTAHPAKFGDTVKEASGTEPILPALAAKAIANTEHYTKLPAEFETVKAYIKNNV